MRADSATGHITLSPEQVQALQRSLEHHLGLSFVGSRVRNLQAGLNAMADGLGLHPDDCARQLAQVSWDGALQALCARHFTVAETYFFREQRAFDLLTEYAREKFARGDELTRVRIWSAGCCTGEECYSAAIVLQRTLQASAFARCSILGTDINAQALQHAARGVYGRHSFRAGEPGALHFASAGEELMRVSSPARDIVSFAEHNLAAPDWPLLMQGMDIILCRNVLMYFSPAQARRCIARLRDCLVEGGWLVVSPSEATPDLFPGFEVVRHPDAIWFRKTAVPAEPRIAAAISAPRVRVPERARSRHAAPAPRVAASPAHGYACDRIRAQDFCQQAAVQAEAGQAGEAALQLRRALYLDPECIPATWLLAVLFERQGRQREARAQLEAASRLLQRLPDDSIVAGTDGLTAASLLAAVRAMQSRLAGLAAGQLPGASHEH